jgi:hypothetical protein
MPERRWHIAQYNVAWLAAPLDDPRMAGFVGDLDRVNGLGDATPGFVWRLKADDGNSTTIRVRDDPTIVVNFTVWETIEQLYDFAYRGEHLKVFQRRREWFRHPPHPYLVLWWVPAGHIPSIEEADERLDHLIAHGPTPYAFTFKQRCTSEEAERFAPLAVP